MAVSTSSRGGEGKGEEEEEEEDCGLLVGCGEASDDEPGIAIAFVPFLIVMPRFAWLRPLWVFIYVMWLT